MKIQSEWTDDRLLVELGERLGQIRLDKNLTQSELAREAGLGLRTVQRLESGAVATQLSGFLRVCRVLGLVERLDLLVPEPVPSPMAQLKLAGKRRRRASGRAVSGTAALGGVLREEPGAWKWGDDA